MSLLHLVFGAISVHVIAAAPVFKLGGTNSKYPGFGCLSGNNHKMVSDATLDACQKHCIATPWCKSLDWYVGRKGHTCSLSKNNFAEVKSTTSTKDCRFYELNRAAITLGGEGYGSKVETQKKYQSMGLSDYTGVRIKREKAVLTLGDARVFRNGKKQLVVDADLVATGDVHVQGRFTLNGLTLQQIIQSATGALSVQVQQQVTANAALTLQLQKQMKANTALSLQVQNLQKKLSNRWTALDQYQVLKGTTCAKGTVLYKGAKQGWDKCAARCEADSNCVAWFVHGIPVAQFKDTDFKPPQTFGAPKTPDSKVEQCITYSSCYATKTSDDDIILFTRNYKPKFLHSKCPAGSEGCVRVPTKSGSGFKVFSLYAGKKKMSQADANKLCNARGLTIGGAQNEAQRRAINAFDFNTPARTGGIWMLSTPYVNSLYANKKCRCGGVDPKGACSVAVLDTTSKGCQGKCALGLRFRGQSCKSAASATVVCEAAPANVGTWMIDDTYRVYLDAECEKGVKLYEDKKSGWNACAKICIQNKQCTSFYVHAITVKEFRKPEFNPPFQFGKPNPKLNANKCQTWKSCSKMKAHKGDGVVFSRNTKLPWDDTHTYHGIQNIWKTTDTYYVYLEGECQTGSKLYEDKKSTWNQCAKKCEENPDCKGFYIHGVAITQFKAKDFTPPDLYGEHKGDKTNDKCQTWSACTKTKKHGGDGFMVTRNAIFPYKWTHKYENGVLTDAKGKVLRKDSLPVLKRWTQLDQYRYFPGTECSKGTVLYKGAKQGWDRCSARCKLDSKCVAFFVHGIPVAQFTKTDYNPPQTFGAPKTKDSKVEQCITYSSCYATKTGDDDIILFTRNYQPSFLHDKCPAGSEGCVSVPPAKKNGKPTILSLYVSKKKMSQADANKLCVSRGLQLGGVRRESERLAINAFDFNTLARTGGIWMSSTSYVNSLYANKQCRCSGVNPKGACSVAVLDKSSKGCQGSCDVGMRFRGESCKSAASAAVLCEAQPSNVGHWTKKDIYHAYVEAECQTGSKLYEDKKSGWNACARICIANKQCTSFDVQGITVKQFNRKTGFQPPNHFGMPDPKYKATKCRTWKSCTKVKKHSGDSIIFSRNTKLPYDEKHQYLGAPAQWTAKDTYYIYLGAECQTGRQLYTNAKAGWSQCAKVCSDNPDCQGVYIHGVAVTHFKTKDFRPPASYGEHKGDQTQNKCVAFQTCTKMKAHGGDGFVITRQIVWAWKWNYKYSKGVLTDAKGKVLRKDKIN